MNLCQQMTGSVTEMGKMGSFATPELLGLFEDWVKALEEEILELLKIKESAAPADLAAKLRLSQESVLFLIGKMAREGKIKITGVQL